MRYISYILIILSIFISGCLSEEEIKARQDNAFDISGTYQTTPDSEIQMSFTITNQNAKHDISISVNRTSPLSAQEQELLSKLATEHGIPVETLTAQPFPVTFGANSNLFGESISGGDNVSRDFGKTSRISICSDNPSEYESQKLVTGQRNLKLEISYCLLGIVKQENKNIIEEGKLSLDASTSYDLEDGVGSSSEGDLDLNFKATKQ